MNKKREIICICCPRGCHLQVDPENDYNVTGNACPNGAAYGKEELTHPTRILTSTVRAEGGRYPRCPVKTAQAVPKEKIVQVMAALDGVTLDTVHQDKSVKYAGTAVTLTVLQMRKTTCT